MSKFTKIAQSVVAISTLIILAACTMGQAPEPTPTAVDVNAVYTAAASTAFAQLTQLAEQVTPTLPPTATEAPTETPTNIPADAATPTQNLVLEITVTVNPVFSVTDTLVPGLPGLPAATLTPIPTLAPVGGAPAASGPVCSNSAFLGDITIPDGTEFKAWDKFTKIWAIQNTGTCTWDDGYAFRMYAGSNMGGDDYYIKNESQFIKPGETVNMGIKMFAPGDLGEYVSHWRMFDDKGQAFGSDFTVVIKVVKK